MVAAPATVKLHEPLPEQPAPLHACSEKPLEAIAVNVTDWPSTKLFVCVEHDVPQLTAAGTLTIEPAAALFLSTVIARSVPIWLVSTAVLFAVTLSVMPPGVATVASCTTAPVPVRCHGNRGPIP